MFLNARYVPIGISVASSFEGSVPKRLVQSQLDRRRVVGGHRSIARRGSTCGSCSAPAGCSTSAWNVGTAVGVLLGDVIGDANRLGLDAAFPALFLALLIPQLSRRRKLVAALLGGGIALVLIPFTPAGVPIIAASAACLVGWRSE